MSEEQQQPVPAAVDPILGIPLETVQSWNAWMDATLTNIKVQQAQRDEQLKVVMAQTAQAQIPGATYGSETNKGLTVLLVGGLGTRKTTWAAQWPKPFFLTFASEGGDDALISYPRIACDMLTKSQEELAPPPVFNVLRPPSKEVHTVGEVMDWAVKISKNHRQWGIATVVVDGLNYLMDLWISEHTAKRRGNKTWVESQRSGKVDLMRPPDWGMLDAFLRDVRVTLGNQGLNVIWTVHEKPIYEGDDKDMMKRDLVEWRPLIKGAQFITLPGACKMHIRAEKVLMPHPYAHGRQVATATYWTTPEPTSRNIRNKYYDAFPHGRLDDPVFQREPTFRALWNQLSNFIYLGP